MLIIDIAVNQFYIDKSHIGLWVFFFSSRRRHASWPRDWSFRRVLFRSELRRRVGMVFQKPNPFPKSIYENVAFGLRLQGVNSRRVLDEVVEASLQRAALWDEVKDRLQ